MARSGSVRPSGIPDSRGSVTAAPSLSRPVPAAPLPGSRGPVRFAQSFFPQCDGLNANGQEWRGDATVARIKPCISQ
ncbi:hypothetical protein GCM10010305_28360 [Streptomyces termitum]|uniref:Uncharacterized protein n=1 Tax=Streptomyces termitum TaxID=67368 RepID=A0A918T3W5_9ACTN|nr:hypothetical protein GCM10010305_28360 [Streptomyces termitum]